MNEEKQSVEMWFSLQSDYCYFLIDRLLRLSALGVTIHLRPVLGLVLRMPEMTANRSQMEMAYFNADTKRTAEFLNLPHSYPDPSPIEFEPGDKWVATAGQPRVERLFTLFVGANRREKGLAFLDVVVRRLWDGSQPGWDNSAFLQDGMGKIGLDHDTVLRENPWESVSAELAENHEAMLAVGHWGVPLMAYNGEPFYGQDRFDQLLWRMGLKLEQV